VKFGGHNGTQMRYIATETVISVFINVIISAIFMMLIFGSQKRIELWGPHGLAFDFAPQTFMITLMSVLVPTALTRRRLRMGSLESDRTARTRKWPRNLWWRALLIAVALTVFLGGLSLGLLALAWKGPVDFRTAFAFKLLYGALVALVATPFSLRIALSEDSGKP
jgi:hypothetical protein